QRERGRHRDCESRGRANELTFGAVTRAVRCFRWLAAGRRRCWLRPQALERRTRWKQKRTIECRVREAQCQKSVRALAQFATAGGKVARRGERANPLGNGKDRRGGRVGARERTAATAVAICSAGAMTAVVKAIMTELAQPRPVKPQKPQRRVTAC